MEEDDIETKEKQEYLRINILEKGYNADDFMEYLEILGGEKGLEIRNWSKNDLVKAVHDFIKSHPKDEGKINFENINYNNNENNNIIEVNDNNINNVNNNNDNENNKIIINENYINEQSEINNQENNNNNKFEYYVNCKISETTEISTKNEVEITISDPQKTEGGLFSKSYITYLIKTKPFNFEVRRRFRDFNWLRGVLTSQYPNCIIPPLAKSSFFVNIDDYTISKRVEVLQKFMTELVTHPLLRNSQILYDFLSIKDKKEFSNKKEVYNALSIPNKIEEMKTLSGEINVEINNKKSAFIETIKKNCENNEELMKKLSKEYKLLNTQIFDVSLKMKDIANIWDELYKKGNQNLEGEKILGIYDVMGKLMEDWAKMEEIQINLINKKVREYFRYIRNEYKCIKDYYNIYENSKNQYIKAHIKLIDIKEDYFENEDVEKWGLSQEDLNNKMLFLRNKELAFSKMLPEETKKVNDYKNLYGGYLNSLIDEYQKIQNFNKIRHKENILLFIKEMIENLADFHVSLTNLISYIDIMKEDIIY